jgi:hypothetical protein
MAARIALAGASKPWLRRSSADQSPPSFSRGPHRMDTLILQEAGRGN